MAETPRMLALRAAVLAGYFMATLSAVGDLFGEDTDQFPPFEGLAFHRLVALFEAHMYVVLTCAAYARSRHRSQLAPILRLLRLRHRGGRVAAEAQRRESRGGKGR